MAHSKREIKPGRAHTKVSGDDEMLRTGFVDGTPLEGGKIADSHPVDLFAAAHRIAESDADDPYSSQPQQQRKEQRQQAADEGTTTTDKSKKNVIAESETVDLAASARGVAEAAASPDAAAATATATATDEDEQQPDRRQDVGGPAAGGRRLGVGRPAY